MLTVLQVEGFATTLLHLSRSTTFPCSSRRQLLERVVILRNLLRRMSEAPPALHLYLNENTDGAGRAAAVASLCAQILDGSVSVSFVVRQIAARYDLAWQCHRICTSRFCGVIM